MRYLDLADTVRREIADGTTGALASEAEMGERFGVSRVTVRRALELLREEGLVASRRGAGWFVNSDPVRQPLGRVTTIEATLEAAGARPARQVLEFAFEDPAPDVAKVLDLARDEQVLRVLRLNLADGEPFALVTVWLPGAIGASVSRADIERATFFDHLALVGVVLDRIVQTITATEAERGEARRLGVREGSPLLACRRVTYDRSGRAVMVSEHRYPAHSIALEVEFPAPHPTGETHG